MAAIVVAAFEDNLALLVCGTRPDLAMTLWPRRRRRALDAGYSWRAWSGLPYHLAYNIVRQDLVPVLAPGVTPGDLETAIATVVLLVNWLPGRIAVRYDPDIVDTFTATTLGTKIPTHALYGQPAFGLFLVCPWLDTDAGVFTSLIPGHPTGRNPP